MNNEHGEGLHHEPQPIVEIMDEVLDEVERAYQLRNFAQQLLDEQGELIRKIESGRPESSVDAQRLTDINGQLSKMFESNHETPHDPYK